MQKKKAISLIVLIITIIVMIILASAIIISLSNANIFNKAEEAVEDTEWANVKQIANLAWADAYTDGIRTVEDVNGIKGLKSRVEEALTKNNVDKSKYIINVTTQGVTIERASKEWIKEGFKIKKGNTVIEIGDIINYDARVDSYDGTWQVLGVDDNGNLLIMSTEDIATGVSLAQSTPENISMVQNDWLNMITMLDGKCEPFGKGRGAIGVARSITVEDVNKVTGYDPDEALYYEGELYQYGNEVTYKYNNSVTPAYSSTIKSGNTYSSHNKGFHYYNGEKIVEINDLTDENKNGQIITTIKNNYYEYDAAELDTINSTENTKAFSMLFGESDAFYWLSSRFSYSEPKAIYHGVRAIVGTNIIGISMWYSDCDIDIEYVNVPIGVRAVVTLSSSIELEGSSKDGWSF